MVKRRRSESVSGSGATDSENQALSGESVSGSGEESSSADSSSAESAQNVPPLRQRAPSGVVIGGPGRRPSGARGKIVVPPGKGKEKVGEKVAGEGKQVGGEKCHTLPTGSCVGGAKGWFDCEDKFVKTPAGACRDDYFRTYGEECYFAPSFRLVTDTALDQKLGWMEYINKPPTFNDSYIEEVRYAFQIPMEYEIRAPLPDERIWNRGNDMWVGIPLEHFRSGFRLPMHRFFHSLLVDMRLGIGQLGPNSVRKVCAFIARCTDLGLEPTLTLFWSLHKLQPSRQFHPLCEFHWVGGKMLGGALVTTPTSNKGWHREYIFVRGGDLGYLPLYAEPDGKTGGIRRSEQFTATELPAARRFAGGNLQGLWTGKDFLSKSFLFTHNRKF